MYLLEQEPRYQHLQAFGPRCKAALERPEARQIEIVGGDLRLTSLLFSFSLAFRFLIFFSLLWSELVVFFGTERHRGWSLSSTSAPPNRLCFALFRSLQSLPTMSRRLTRGLIHHVRGISTMLEKRPVRPFLTLMRTHDDVIYLPARAWTRGFRRSRIRLTTWKSSRST